MYGYIYLTTNLINGKRYIGRHKKEFFDPYYKGSGTLLTEAFKKYGINNFNTELIEECNSEEELNEREIYWIDHYNAAYRDDFYNIALGGVKCRFTAETRMKMSLKKKGKHPWNYGKKKTEEECKKLSESLKGRKSWAKGLTKETDERVAKWATPHSEETKKKISEAKKGQPSPLKGRNLSQEHKDKIRKNRKGIKLTEEQKRKCSEAHKKAVLCVELNVVYDSFLDAAKACGFKSRNPIYYCVNGKQETAGGYHWKLIEEDKT